MIILVDDSSTATTAEVAREKIKDYHVFRVIMLSATRSIEAMVRAGILKAREQLVFFQGRPDFCAALSMLSKHLRIGRKKKMGQSTVSPIF